MPGEGLKNRRIGCGLLAGVVVLLVLVSTLTASPFTFTAMQGDDLHAMTFPAGADPTEIAEAAREKCTQASICSVYGWAEGGQVAGALPMTEREAATLAFQYSLNRNTGLDRTLFDCARFPRTNRSECLAKEG